MRAAIMLSIWALILMVGYGIVELQNSKHWTRTVQLRPVNMTIEVYGNLDATAPGGKIYLVEGDRRVETDMAEIERIANGG